MHARSLFASLLLVAASTAPAAANFRYGEFVDATCSANGWEPALPFNPNGADPTDPNLVNCSLCHSNVQDPDNDFLTDGGFLFFDSDYTDVSYFCSPSSNHTPSFVQVGPQTLSVGMPFVLNVRASDPDLDMMLLTVSNAPPGSSFTDLGDGGARFWWTPGPADVGNRVITFHAADTGTPMKVGTLVVPLTVAGLAVNHPPVLAPIGNHYVEVGVELAFSLSATDEDGGALQYSALGLPAGASLVGTAFSFTPDSTQVGNHDVTFMVTDSASPAAADSETITISVGEANRPPVLSPIGNRSLVVGKQMQIAMVASDPDGDPLTLACAGLPSAAVFTDLHDGTATIDWSPGAAGSSVVTCTASDDAVPPLTAAEMFALTATEPPVTTPKPVLEAAHWNSRGSVLWVRGHSEVASGKQRIAIYGIAGDGSPYLLGTGMSSGRGRFTIELRPFVAPCQVMAEVEGVSGDAVAVSSAPAHCGEALLTHVHADLTGRRNDVLHVEGHRGPLGGAVVVVDAATGVDLARIPVRSRGHFSYEGKVGAPRKIKLRAEAAGMTWTGDESVAVHRGECHLHHKHGRH